MEIRKIPIDKINPAPYNPRLNLQPGDIEFEKIKRSIAEFDLVEPLVWNETTGFLVGGHQRLKVLKLMGIAEVDVSVVHIEDSQREQALNIALNRVQGDWDYSKLKELLVELDDGNFDLSLTGFDEQELKDLIDYDGKEGLTDEDDAPSVPDKPVTVLGDIYKIGDHRLVCGDSLSIDDVNLLMDGHKADMVFTDPPYGVSYSKKNQFLNKMDKGNRVQTEIANDNDLDNLPQFLIDVFGNYRLSIKDGASLYVCYAPSAHSQFEKALNENDFDVRQQIIWAKNQFVFGLGRYKWQHESIFYAHVKGESDAWYGDNSQSTLWNENKPSSSKLHPTMKPVELIQRALINSSKSGDIVLDLFGGSGSTLIACEKLGRRCFTMEIDPGYCDVIVKRWENFTGRKAERISEEEESRV